MELFKLVIHTVVILQLFTILILAKSVQDPTKLVDQQQNSKSITSLSSSTTSDADQLIRKARQSRCIRCFDDRYLDDGRGYYSYNRYNYGTGGGGGGGAGGRVGGYDDRSSWYYPERYDGYASRGQYDRYPDSTYGSRYDDRYNPRTYDGYDNRYNYNDRYDSRPDYRGYGHDNRDRYYEQPPVRGGDAYPPRDRYYDRPRSGYEGRYSYYDRETYDRYPYRGGAGGGYYDYKNYRPFDETYRGTSGFDSSGRGYYFANRQNEHSNKPGPGQPYLPHSQSPPRPIQPLPPNSSSQTPPPSYPPSSSSSSSSSVSSGPSSYYHYQHNSRPSRPDEDSSKGGYAGGWGYVNDRDKMYTNYDDRNKDIQSSPYGPRPRPIGGSYLHDRDSNIPSSSAGVNNNKDGKQQHQDDKFKDPGSLSSSSSSSSLNNDGKKSNSIDGVNKMTN